MGIRRGAEGWGYRLGIDGVVFGASLPGAGLPGALPVSGIVLGGEADGARSLFGLSPTPPRWFESVQPATSAVNSTNPQSPDTSVLILSSSRAGEPWPLLGLTWCSSISTSSHGDPSVGRSRPMSSKASATRERIEDGRRMNDDRVAVTPIALENCDLVSPPLTLWAARVDRAARFCRSACRTYGEIV